MRILLVATTNQGKIREIKNLLHDIPYEIKTLKEMNFSLNVSETGKTFRENAILKAETFGKKSKLLTLAEDSGLEVDALNGAPGVYSARYADGSDTDRLNKLLTNLSGVPVDKRTARYKAVAVFFDPDSKKTVVKEGVTEGYITTKSYGSNGFGYDPVFFSFELNKTFGQSTDIEKNRVSHRAKAIEKLRSELL
jgi:XTP/dITP diphosphohydrolase